MSGLWLWYLEVGAWGVVPLGSTLAAGLYGALLPSLSAGAAGRRAERLRGTLDEPIASLEPKLIGKVVVVRGRLEAEAPFDGPDGACAAASLGASNTTHWWSDDDEARVPLGASDGLVLRAGDEPVELRGGIDVVVGQRELWPGEPLRERASMGAGGVSSIAIGAEVVVRGRVVTDDDEERATGYRDRDRAYALEGVDEDLEIWSVDAPTVRLPWRGRLRHRALLMAAIVTAVALAWSPWTWHRARAAAEVGCQRDCEGDDSGRCGVARGRVDFVCTATDAGCAKTERCKREGSCSAIDGRCGARSDDDCKRTTDCVRHGRCRASAGWCVN